MVDVSAKPSSNRTAVAEARVELGAEIVARFENNDLDGPKGPVLQTAIIAGTMAVKKTSELIPFCHPLRSHHHREDGRRDGGNDWCQRGRAHGL